MSNPAQALINLTPSKDYLVAIDSDGCAFDAMGIKQCECFCPMMIAYFNLQPVAGAARECKMFADLFSKTRGANRHKTIARILTELLPSHPIVKERGFKVPEFKHYVEWVHNPNSLLSNEGLQQAINNASDSDSKKELQQGLLWSKRVNEMVAEVCKGVPPFPYVRQSIEKVAEKADVIVCSATPSEALEREWAEHGLAHYVKAIAGQEMGKKAEHLAIVSNGKYDKDKIIMVGDAPGDLKAAKDNDLAFYAINPGDEARSWKRFHDEAFDKFMAGRYAGKYEKMVIDEFETCLPEHPQWS
jgi:phosphoglycolate phosphatase-like HAD superfamily hydrolase